MLVTPRKRQSLFDVLLENQGSVAKICEVAISNNLSITEPPTPLELNVVSNNITNSFKSYNIPATFYKESEVLPIGEAEIGFNFQIYGLYE